MGKLDIKIYPDSVLRKKTEEIDKVDGEIKRLAEDMIETMRGNDGAGLAGPQVGVSKRIFVLDIGKGPMVFINPKISNKRGKEFDFEGCLSFPGLSLKIKRAGELKCKFLDEKGEQCELEADGLLARVIQHENDHLEGTLFIDRIGFWQRRKVLRDLK